MAMPAHITIACPPCYDACDPFGATHRGSVPGTAALSRPPLNRGASGCGVMILP